VLRECRRVLKPGGRIAGYVIHVAPGLSRRYYERAVDLGPSEVGAREDPARLHELTGFAEVRQVDTTDQWLDTTSSFIRARERHEEGLRIAEGDEAYEEEQAKKRGLVEGMTAGILRRCLVAGRAS
jgi:hypothetical protein